MRHEVASVSVVAAVLGLLGWAGATEAQDQPRAAEGRGLLHRPADIADTLRSAPPPHAFEPDASGVFARTIFETDENPNFKIVIRDFSFPPDGKPHTVTLPSGAFLHLLSGSAEISVARQRLALTPFMRTAVPAGAPIEVTNSGDQNVVVRAVIVEAK